MDLQKPSTHLDPLVFELTPSSPLSPKIFSSDLQLQSHPPNYHIPPTVLQPTTQISANPPLWRNLIRPYLNISEFVDIYRPKGRLILTKLSYKQSVVDYKSYPRVFSRAYFKLIEILQLVLLPANPIRVCMLAEGPGGFIQALTTLRNNPSDIYNCITLKCEYNDWNSKMAHQEFKHLRNKFPINLSYGTGNGNLLYSSNREHFVNVDLEGQKCFLVTADGGIDCDSSEDYKHKEIVNFKLFLAETVMALRVCQRGGIFVIKMYSLYSQLSVQLVVLLCLFFSRVRVVKPRTSRPANSEKYLLCQDLKEISKVQLAELELLLVQVVDLEENTDYFSNQLFVCSVLSFAGKCVQEIKERVRVVTEELEREQVVALRQGIELCERMSQKGMRIDGKEQKWGEDEGIQKRMQEQVKYAVQWCQYYGVPLMIQN